MQKFSFKYAGNPAIAAPKGKYYPAEDVVFQKGPSPVRNPPKVRSSIAPGSVLILLAGRFRGKRVVCLKVLSSGLLLVSGKNFNYNWSFLCEHMLIIIVLVLNSPITNLLLGPYSLNGVPLRRVNQRYVISTSAKVDLSGVDVSGIDDAFFARASDAAGNEAQLNTRRAAQKEVDGKLEANVAKVEMLSNYLQAKFSLSGKDRPHAMAF
jgi:large subunit ribosomal protein L6e